MLLPGVSPAAALPLRAEGDYTPYDQGVRHIATLAGYFSYGLMALTVCFGILTTTGWARRSVKRQTLYGGHMMLAVISLTFGFLHGLAYAFQTSEHFTFLMVFVPLASGGEPEVALGIVGLELSIAVAISIWFQRRLGYRRWHILHWGAYLGFGLSLAHTVAASPEVRSLGGVGLVVAAAAGACLLLFVLRLLPATSLVKARIAPQEV
jgi:DMSO/TMAO reductase YedYZ heme-binding membrane subunit